LQPAAREAVRGLRPHVVQHEGVALHHVAQLGREHGGGRHLGQLARERDDAHALAVLGQQAEHQEVVRKNETRLGRDALEHLSHVERLGEGTQERAEVLGRTFGHGASREILNPRSACLASCG